ncbi:CGNR zinc finger domain-containing protein [Microvirga sp. KLBC 81]|uniref:CGNR zinc finger domain-containing protein n=1 Tax=Microvirga sp. KLBC 81 TaxID=1862707 RepID=UPI00140334EB|nr:CGNR zinc finger domain-containing protein [Microvirga sp. KLBC 81]
MLGEETRAGQLPLVGGILALDFTNTSSGRGSEAHLDHIRTTEHLILWAVHSGILAGQDAERIRMTLARDKQKQTELLVEALDVRELIYRIASRIASKSEPSKRDLARLRDEFRVLLEPASLDHMGDGRYDWSFPEKPVTSSIIGPIVLSAVEMLRQGQLDRLKQCPGRDGDCGWLFFDRTKNASRRWCEMSVCGNRAKVRRHRERQFWAEDVG